MSAWPWAVSDLNAQTGPPRDQNEDDAGDDDVGDQLMQLDLTKEKDEHEEAVKEASEGGLRSISLYVSNSSS